MKCTNTRLVVGSTSYTTWKAIEKLASCPWGPATAYGVGVLTKLYVILVLQAYTNEQTN